MLTLPGLIDPHVHLRTPGQTHKEDFTTGTMAALAGGFTTIIDMPNNATPITTLERLNDKISIAKAQTVCDLGFHFGTLGDNLEEFSKVQNSVMGLKIYLNQTTGGFVVNLETLPKIVEAWPKKLPILFHAEEDIIEQALSIVKNADQRAHVCHVSSESELQKIINAKKGYDKITCGVCPHHLFLTAESAEKLGSFGKMKPELKHRSDVNFMWSHLNDIDIIESDHAPHTIEEKNSGDVPSGVPGLETTLPLLLTSVHEGKLSVEDLKRLCHDNASKIFGIQEDEKTYIEIDENEEWTIKNENLYTKCKWSPFDGWNVKGKLKNVFIRGEKVFENGKVLAKPGSGTVLP
jgi:carbamoyl-phosphate synthase/aspartate carbamoyltransferase/dihydroorotase